MKLKGEENVPTFFELRPDRLLVNPNFQGYKLSLETLPSYVISLNAAEVDHAIPTEEQYTMQHVKLSALNNHVLPDPWNPGCVYIVDSAWTLWKCSVSGERLGTLTRTWVIHDSPYKKPGRFNVSLVFPDAQTAVCSDGCGTVYILETGPRNSEDESTWKVIFKDRPFDAKKTPQCLVLDAIPLSGRGSSVFDLLFLRIDERGQWKDFLEFHQDTYLSSSQHPFVSVLEWITFAQNPDGTLRLESSRSLVGRSGVEYASIERNGSAIYIASDDPFYFASDSVKPVAFSTAPRPDRAIADEAEKKTPDYAWYQSETEINLWFRLPEESKKQDLIVDFTVNDIHVEYKKQVLLTGKLFETIKPDESTWTIESGRLEIILTKSVEGLWSEFVPGNKDGERIEDPALVDQIHSQLAHLCSDKWGADPHNTEVYDPQGLEECDENPSFTAALIRVDLSQQRITNKASLDNHQWLFSVKTDPSLAPCLCIRHDVDAIVWQPQIPVLKSNEAGDSGNGVEWNCKHVATFAALGYLQAAKERKKFAVSSPDFSYAVICDDVKHVYIYRQPSPIENDLRNRKTGTIVSHIAKQQLIALEPPLEVMGAYAGNDFLFVLTSKNLHLIRVNATEDV